MPRTDSDSGRDHCFPLDSYRPPSAGQPPASKVLSHHGLPFSLAGWGLGEIRQQTENIAPGNKRKTKQKRPALKLGCWNVRTMMTGLSENLQDTSNARKTAVINQELNRLKVDIATLQEKGLADSGSLRENNHTIFWQGKSATELRRLPDTVPMSTGHSSAKTSKQLPYQAISGGCTMASRKRLDQPSAKQAYSFLILDGV